MSTDLEVRPSNLAAPRETTRRRGSLHDPCAAVVASWRAQHAGSRTLGICSCERREGSSTVASSLAISIAEVLELRALLIDANIYNPSLHRTFSLDATPGLADLLAGEADLSQCLQTALLPRLTLMSVGSLENICWPDFEASKLHAMFAEVKNDFDIVIVDLPSVAEMATGINYVGTLDGLLLVLRAEKTKTRSALWAKEQLLAQSAPILGTVLNQRRRHIPEWLDRWL